MGDTEYHQSAAIAIIVLNILSLLSLIFVIAIYALRWKNIASFPMRLSFYLCISCLVQNLYVMLYNPILINQQVLNGFTTSPYCVFQSVLKTAFDLSSILWTSLIIFSSYASVVLKYNLEQKQYVYLILGYLFPILVALIPIFLGYYGFDGYFCWFSAQDLTIELGLKVGYFFGPLWILFFLEIYWSLKTFVTLKDLGLEQRELNIFKKLLMFPLILLITGLFATIDLIFIYASGTFIEWLDILSLILLSLYGLFTSIAYGFNPLIQEQILILVGAKRESIDQKSSNDQSRSSRSSKRSLAQMINV